jgi:hypothetical protein
MNLLAAPVKARLIFSLPTRLEIKPPLHSGCYEVHGPGGGASYFSFARTSSGRYFMGTEPCESTASW